MPNAGLGPANQLMCWAAAGVFILSALAQQSESEAIASATAQIQRGDFRGAKSLLEKSVQAQPGRPELWNLLGIADTELQDISSAKAAFERGLKLAPDSVSLHENAGLLFYRQADYSNARQYLARAVALGSKKPGVLF